MDDENWDLPAQMSEIEELREKHEWQAGNKQNYNIIRSRRRNKERERKIGLSNVACREKKKD